MNSVIMPKKLRKIVYKIYQHPNNVYSIVLKDEETIWCNNQIELYDSLNHLAAKSIYGINIDEMTK